MEVKTEPAVNAPVVKIDNQNPNIHNKQQQQQGGGPSGKFNNNQGGNKFNNANQRQNNKNFQPKGNRMQMGNRGPPKGEVSVQRVSPSFFLVFFLFFPTFSSSIT